MSLPDYSPHPADPKPTRAGWPFHGFVYKDAGVEKLKTPAGTVVNASAVRVPNAITASDWAALEAANGWLGNTAWRLKRPGWTPPAIPSGEAASEDALGRTWLGHAVVYRGRYLYGALQSISTAWAGWWFAGSTGPVCDVYARQVPYYSLPDGPATKWKIDALVVTPVPAYGALTAAAVVVPLDQSITSAVADVETSVYQQWRLSDFSDDGRVALLYLGGVSDALAVVTISGEYPSLTASIQAVSPRQYADVGNFTHPLHQRTRTYNDAAVVYDDADLTIQNQHNTASTRYVRAIDHDGSLLYWEEAIESDWNQYYYKHETVECAPGDVRTKIVVDSTATLTVTWAGNTFVATDTNGSGNWLAHNGIKYGPVVIFSLHSHVYSGLQSCTLSMLSSSHQYAAFYKGVALANDLNGMQPYQFAIDPDSKQVTVWPSGVSFV